MQLYSFLQLYYNDIFCFLIKCNRTRFYNYITTTFFCFLIECNRTRFYNYITTTFFAFWLNAIVLVFAIILQRHLLLFDWMQSYSFLQLYYNDIFCFLIECNHTRFYNYITTSKEGWWCTRDIVMLVLEDSHVGARFVLWVLMVLKWWCAGGVHCGMFCDRRTQRCSCCCCYFSS